MNGSEETNLMIGGNVTDLEKWHRDIMLESMAEGIERERAAVEMRRKEEEEKRKQMFPTPWEKDL